MKQPSSQESVSPIKFVFWLVFIFLLMLGIGTLYREWVACNRTTALIKDLQNRALNYGLQLQKTNQLRNTFTPVAESGYTIEGQFLTFQNRLELSVFDVEPRVCQKIIQSDYKDPIEIIIDDKIVRREKGQCPTTTNTHMVFQYNIHGYKPTTEIAANPLCAGGLCAQQKQEKSENTASDLALTGNLENTTSLTISTDKPIAETDLAQRSSDTQKSLMVIKNTEPAQKQPVIATKVETDAVQIAPRQRSPMRRLARYKELSGETLGDVVSAESKRKNVIVSHQTFADTHPTVAILNELPTTPVEAQNKLPAQSAPVSLTLDHYPAHKNASPLENYLLLVPNTLHEGRLEQKTQYQRPMHDDAAYVIRTGIKTAAPTY